MRRALPAAVGRVLSALGRRGVVDGFRVEVRHSPSRPVVGWYRAGSQFKPRGAVVVLNAAALVEAGDAFETEVELTVGHEYGHIVWEWARLRGPAALEASVVEATSGGEEDFAEGFAQTLAGRAPDAGIERVLREWGRILAAA